MHQRTGAPASAELPFIHKMREITSVRGRDGENGPDMRNSEPPPRNSITAKLSSASQKDKRRLGSNDVAPQVSPLLLPFLPLSLRKVYHMNPFRCFVFVLLAPEEAAFTGWRGGGIIQRLAAIVTTCR